MARKIRDYTDVGHGNRKASVWIFKDTRIWAFSSGTHESNWGAGAMYYWRGRYEPDTRMLSIAAPANVPVHHPLLCPQWLINMLEEKFGRAVKIYEFDLKTQRVKRRARR